MRHTTRASLRAVARTLQGSQSDGGASVDFITFGMATEYLRAVVGNDWTNQMVFGPHGEVERANQPGRDFLRAEGVSFADRYRNQMRTLRLAELIFNLQAVEGIDARLEDLRRGNVEATLSELEAGVFIWQRTGTLRYVDRSGVKGTDYDVEVPLAGGARVNC